MFDQMIIERIRMERERTFRDNDGIDSSMKPVQFKTSLLNHFLSILGDTMISLGFKLKDHSNACSKVEKAQAPNFLIML
jgi:hypothetical protein